MAEKSDSWFTRLFILLHKQINNTLVTLSRQLALIARFWLEDPQFLIIFTIWKQRASDPVVDLKTVSHVCKPLTLKGYWANYLFQPPSAQEHKHCIKYENKLCFHIWSNVYADTYAAILREEKDEKHWYEGLHVCVVGISVVESYQPNQ